MDKQIIYALIMFRKDIGPSNLLETNDFDKVKETWRNLTNKWTLSVKEQKPFELEEPVITSFDPSLIKEFRISTTETSLKIDESNPYLKNFRQKGFTESFRENTSLNTEVLDQGYKYK